MTARRTVGLIGGSGLGEFLSGGKTRTHRVSTPWGAPSGPIQEGMLGATRVLFLPRHGIGHTIPPHRVNYRANIDALASLGAEAVLTVSAVGSLREALSPGSFVLPDQFVDFTKARPTTFFDGGKVYHVSLADPFCPDLLGAVRAAGERTGTRFASPATYVCVEGPRFSTRAESRYFRGFADVIGMTLVPEVTLARERGLCYACVATVTDYDVWQEAAVEAHDIVEVMRRNSEAIRRLLAELLPAVAELPVNCRCSRALDSASI